MVEFFEPEDQYQTDKGNQRNIKTKINLITFLIILGGSLVLAVNNDVIKVFGKEVMRESCIYSSTYMRVDDDDLKLEKARKALATHVDNFKEIDGYAGAEIKLREAIKNRKTPEIYVYLEEYSKEKTRVPDTLCGFTIVKVIE